VDTLPEGAKQLLQVGSLITFSSIMPMRGMRLGLFPEAEVNLRLGLAGSQKTDFVVVTQLAFMHLGTLLTDLGRYQEAQECWDGHLAVFERSKNFPSLARLVQILKAASGVRGYFNPQTDEVLKFDLKYIKLKYVEGRAAHAMGEIYLHIDDAHRDEAESWIKKAIEINERNKIP
jgi:tetratricopeptide (TPR) repeat protein